ncbi:MAG TPA: hypothetical protein EYH49_00200 [Aquifex aeolicus]|nr:hypothetical protein [Aquifex aeolicus]
MEGRRVEGVFLNASILKNRAHEAYESAEAYRIRILSRVPEALLSALGEPGSRLRARVVSSTPSKVVLKLEGGLELEATNRLAVGVSAGEELLLSLESRKPLTLRVERSFYGVGSFEGLVRGALELAKILGEESSLKKVLDRSGLFYEKKVWDFIRGAIGKEDLSGDAKFSILKGLEEVDTDALERFLKTLKLSQPLEGEREAVLKALRSGNKPEFFLSVLRFLEKLSSAERSLKASLDESKRSIRELMKGFLEALTRAGAEINERILSGLESSPRALRVFIEATKSFELGDGEAFSKKLSLLGVKVEKGAIPLLRELSHVAKERIEELGKVRTELEFIKGVREGIEERLAPAREGLKNLSDLTALQYYLLLSGGRKFLLPMKIGEGKGFMGISLREVFRVYIALHRKEGFLGVFIEAPKKEKPDFITVIFYTDSHTTLERLKGNLKKLRESLSSLGLEVRKLEVLGRKEEDFSGLMSEELGSGLFNLRV